MTQVGCRELHTSVPGRRGKEGDEGKGIVCAVKYPLKKFPRNAAQQLLLASH